MRDVADIEAAQLAINWNTRQGTDISNSDIKFETTSDPWLISIASKSFDLMLFAERTTNYAVQIYRDQIRTEARTDGRLIDPAHPVQLSGGVLDMAEFVGEVEHRLGEFEDIPNLDQKASFGYRDGYEEVAKSGINFSRTVVPRLRLFVHTYLWIMWVHEALNQANRFGGLLQSNHNLERFSSDAFPYISHPPIIVATIGCSTMIEEVGAEYVNSHVEGALR